VNPTGSRRWSFALLALALLFPVGWVVLPRLWPARSHMPVVRGPLNAPVLLITVGGLRADRVHHLGYEREITPAIDRLAEQGISFRTCWAQSNQSPASAGALLTGRCPLRTGLLAAGDKLKSGHETIAEVFARNGFRTAAVVADPELLNANLEQGFEAWEPRAGQGSAAIVDEALRQVDAAGDRPWLLWVDFGDLLAPYGGAELDPAAFAPDAPPGFGAAPEDYDLTDATLAARGWGEQQLAWLDARYDAALARLDGEIGRLFEGLSARNRLETSTVCLAGLRGERLAERPPRRFTHGVDLFEGSLQVPLVFRLPAQEARGQRIARLAQLIDVGPTLIEIALKQPWRTTSGRSLKPVMQDLTQVNKALLAQGFVQEAPGEPPRAATAVRFGAGKGVVKALVGADGALLSTFRFADDAGEQHSLTLAGEQVSHLVQQWTAALGDQSTCVPGAK
jgi:arylsulfatase A-like enzyme